MPSNPYLTQATLKYFFKRVRIVLNQWSVHCPGYERNNRPYPQF